MNSQDDMPTDIGDKAGDGLFPGEDETRVAGSSFSGESGYIEDETVIESESKYGGETELEHERAITEAILWVKQGRRRGHYYPIRHGTVIGRDQGSLILDDSKASATHARITFENKHYVIWDFGSSNGTFVNGKRIRQATPLDENDVIKIGNTVFVLKLLYQIKKVEKRKYSQKSKRPIKKSLTEEPPTRA